jgi:GT2 family glycosyltransferase
MERNKLTASIVLYHTEIAPIKAIIKAFIQLPIAKHLYLIDHSSKDDLKDLAHIDKAVSYHFMNQNNGYGAGHNIAINWAIKHKSMYHLVLNPDIEFEASALHQIINKMDSSPEIGLLMPKILYPSGATQYLCKLLPTPFDLLGRRFLPGFVKKLFQQQMMQYECRHLDYNKTMDIPNLSGCFMFMRTDALQKVGPFDTRFFMYLEDTDLSRRINTMYRTVYFPEVEIIHHYYKGSYQFNKLLVYHIQSAIKYFNKWGWFFDNYRNKKNKALKA